MNPHCHTVCCIPADALTSAGTAARSKYVAVVFASSATLGKMLAHSKQLQRVWIPHKHAERPWSDPSDQVALVRMLTKTNIQEGFCQNKHAPETQTLNKGREGRKQDRKPMENVRKHRKPKKLTDTGQA